MGELLLTLGWFWLSRFGSLGPFSFADRDRILSGGPADSVLDQMVNRLKWFFRVGTETDDSAFSAFATCDCRGSWPYTHGHNRGEGLLGHIGFIQGQLPGSGKGADDTTAKAMAVGKCAVP